VPGALRGSLFDSIDRENKLSGDSNHDVDSVSLKKEGFCTQIDETVR
jgi:hypothetical protein